MRIAVNTRLLIKNKLEGIGWFSYETLRRIVQQHPDVEFYFLFDRDYDLDFIFAPNVHPVVIGPQARHPFLFVWWFDLSVPRALKSIKPDLFLSPDGYLSLSTQVPSLAVIHDINFEHFPKDLPWLVRHYYRFYFPRFARKAKRIATVSEFSKEDIVKQYAIDPGKIDVVYNGANENFVPISENEIEDTKRNFSHGHPYFLFVGSLQPRKNLARLFRAFDAFKQKAGGSVKLLVVGEKKWWTTEIRQAFEAMVYAGDVIFAGRLEPEQLRKVTASALASLYVSYFEGFGIPIVEAFRCGVPVITANATATAEIAGDAALLINPFDESDITQAMLTVSQNEPLRRALIAKGLARAQDFSWDRTAANLWQSIMRAVHN